MDGEITVEDLRSLLDGDADGGADAGVAGGTDAGTAEDAAGVGPGDLRVVDIRNPDAYARGHIPGSENIPAPALTDRIEELDGSGRVVTVCPHGEASVQAARLVGAYEGVDGPVESLAGGLTAWDGPLATDEGTEDDASGAGTTDDPPAPF